MVIRLTKNVKLENGLESEGGGFLRLGSKASSEVTAVLCVAKDGGFPGGSDGKESACDAGALGSIPGWGRSPGEGNGCPHQYSGLENPMDRGVWRATVHGVSESRI